MLEKEIEISCGHILDLHYPSPCTSLHGHNYLIKVRIGGKINKEGMVVDFNKIKDFFAKFDHKTFIPPKYHNLFKRLGHDEWFVYVDFNPTVENLAKFFKENLIKFFNLEGCLIDIKETLSGGWVD
jgi:6-pyruvoyltetrahydropterin/6-carboxytetrahydropterin synthase